MSLPATDNFNRANSLSLGANWTVTSPMNGGGILSNQAAERNGVIALAAWNADTFASDHYAQAIVVLGGSEGPAVCVSGTNGYVAYWAGAGSSSLVIYRYDSGVPTLIANAGPLAIAGNLVRIERVGSGLTVKVGGTTLLTATDSTYMTGAAGLLLELAVGVADDWEGGNMPSGGYLLVNN